MAEEYFVGVDVGTGSARACVIDNSGEILAVTTQAITKWEPKPDYFNQSSTEIWDAVCSCVKNAVLQAKIDATLVKGIGFDATCSLVVLNETTDEPVAVGPEWSTTDQNIILWMDHRAGAETNEINDTKHKCLKYVGGKMSIEMEIPKAKWLKENMPEGEFDKCKFYDLADFLTHKASGSEDRSFCSIVCKQGYVPVGIDGSVKGWSKDFLESINLPELAEDNFRRLGGVNGENGTILSAGQKVGTLTEETAERMGLTTDVAVGSSVIDCYAGWIGTIAAKVEYPNAAHHEEDDTESEHGEEFKSLKDSIGLVSQRLAAVAGTSTCHLVMSKDPVFVPGVWGPYRDVIFPNRWLAEGGQSCTGELLHHVLTTHPSYNEVGKLALTAQVSIFEWLNTHLERMLADENAPTVAYLARHYFFYGDLHGNRSPIADATMKGSVVGLNMNTGLDNLAIAYYGAVEFIGQQTRHIIDTLNKEGHNIKEIYLSGGQCRNPLLTQTMATATGLPVVIPHYIDAAVVLGSAMIGAKAATDGKKSLWNIMSTMSKPGTVVLPEPEDSINSKLLKAKYDIFLDMADRQRKYRQSIDKVVG